MINTTLCYIYKDHKYLMLLRNKKKNDLNAQKWIGVGGKFLDNETADECLIREVFEETNLKLTSFEKVGVIKFISDEWEDEDMHLYIGYDFEGELIKDCPEGELIWVEEDKLLTLPTWEGDKYFLKAMTEGRRNLNMTVRYKKDELAEFRDDTGECKVNKASFIRSPHGFSTRKGGVSEGVYKSLNLGMNRGDIDERVRENLRRFFAECQIPGTRFVYGQQIHSNIIHTVDENDMSEPFAPALKEGDGFVTASRHVPLAVFTADCVPVLLEDINAGVIGAVHSGWRGTVADIGKNAVESMLKLGAKKENIRIAIGPSIQKCCFEVGDDVINAVKELLPGDAKRFYTPKDIPGKYLLDLTGVVRERFIKIGIDEKNIEKIEGCTMCSPSDYFSHRHMGSSRGSLMSAIMLD